MNTYCLFVFRQHQLRDDARELRILKDMFMDEEEDNGRERKFRWKNIDQNLAMEYISKFHENIPLTEDNGSEDEREMEYRKMRHERESMLNKSSEKVLTILLYMNLITNVTYHLYEFKFRNRNKKNLHGLH